MELQEEEREVLLSIYDGDPAFNQLSPITFQYKYGEEGKPKSFLLEISWGEDYPKEIPTVNLNTFYNSHISKQSKQRISQFIHDEAEPMIGTAMTYSLFECLKEKAEELITDDNETVLLDDDKISGDSDESQDDDDDDDDDDNDNNESNNLVDNIKTKRLTKSQKRKQWDVSNFKGEKPRGWDWVDIVKHLSQCGTEAYVPDSAY